MQNSVLKKTKLCSENRKFKVKRMVHAHQEGYGSVAYPSNSGYEWVLELVFLKWPEFDTCCLRPFSFQKCMPPFRNVVAEKLATVTPETATCGLRNKIEYCIQTLGIYRECDVCDGTDLAKSHPPEYLTDTQNNTWWQSITMLEGIHMDGVNLTVNLGKHVSANRPLDYLRIIAGECLWKQVKGHRSQHTTVSSNGKARTSIVF